MISEKGLLELVQDINLKKKDIVKKIIIWCGNAKQYKKVKKKNPDIIDSIQTEFTKLV